MGPALFFSQAERARRYDVLKRYINAVAVAAHWRRRGVSRLLLAAAMDHIKDSAPHGTEKPISLYVTAGNATDQPFLVNFYENLGFECCSGGFLPAFYSLCFVDVARAQASAR